MSIEKNEQLRSTFKQQHFAGVTDLDCLFTRYRATRAFYTNTTNNGAQIKFPSEIINDKLGLSPEALELYNIYEHEILNVIKQDSKLMPLIEYRVCRDLIEMEYMLGSEEFYAAYQNLDAALLKTVKKRQRDYAKQGVPNYLAASQIGCGEACFILYLHPEFEDTVTHMMKDFKLPEPAISTLEKTRKYQQYVLGKQMDSLHQLAS